MVRYVHVSCIWYTSFPSLIQDNMIFPMVVGLDSGLVQGKLYNFVQYNVKYVMFILAYIIIILHLSFALLQTPGDDSLTLTEG